MATGTGKAKRKTKGKTVDLQSFLSADNPTTPEGYTAIPNVSWTSLMENDDINDSFSIGNDKPQVILPTAPKAARPPNIDLSKVPTNAPFKAHLANLPYDINEDDIVSFFRKLEIKEVQLPRDGGRLKGFGYAEFHDRDTLIEALNFNNETLKTRSIAVSLPSNDGSHDERRPFRQRDDHRRDRDDQREDRTDENWRSQNQRPALSDQRFNSRNGDFGPSSRGFESDRRSDRNFESDRRSDRNFESERRFGDGRRDRDRQFGSSFVPRGQSPTHSNERDLERNQEAHMDGPKERKKLVLKPRTVKTEASEKAANTNSIFGEAKPVDTTAREREVEEKFAKKEEEIFERKELARRDSEDGQERLFDVGEGRRSRKASESGSAHRDEHFHEPKHIQPPPGRVFDEKPNFRRSNFERRDNRPQIKQRDHYEHDSYRRPDGDGYGFKNRSREGDTYDSRNRNNFSNTKYDSLDARRNNKSFSSYNNNNRYSQPRRDFGESDNRNFSQNRNNNNHVYADAEEQNVPTSEGKAEYKSSNKFDLLANDVQDIDGASN